MDFFGDLNTRVPVAATPQPVPVPVATAPRQARSFRLKRGKTESNLYKVITAYNSGSQYKWVVRKEGTGPVEKRDYLFTNNAVEFAEANPTQVGFTNLQQPGRKLENPRSNIVQAFLDSRKTSAGTPLRRAILKKSYEQRKKK